MKRLRKKKKTVSDQKNLYLRHVKVRYIQNNTKIQKYKNTKNKGKIIIHLSFFL